MVDTDNDEPEVPLNEPEPDEAQANAVPRPDDPLMGTTEETYDGSNSYYYAFGGKPDAHWMYIDGLDDRRLSDQCFRPIDPVSGQKSSSFRQKGLAVKFTSKQRISDFQDNMWEFLRHHALDTVAYLQDPKNSNEVLSVVVHHSHFTPDLDKTKQLSKYFQNRFDKWDKKHDREAINVLMNSLSDTVKKGFNPHRRDDESFAMTWVRFMYYLLTTTSSTFDKIKDTIRKMRPQSYPGQDIEKMAADFIDKAEELENAGYYEHALTLSMIDGFLFATRDPQGTFHHQLNTMRTKVEDLRKTTLFMDAHQRDKQFASEKLTYRDVCGEASKQFRTQRQEETWLPLQTPTDRKAPPSAFLADKFSDSQVMMLVEAMKSGSNKGGGRDSSRRSSNKPSSSKPRSSYRSDGNKDVAASAKSKQRRHNGMAKWKLVAPKSGESNTKTVNGRVYNWCAKCGNWTTTHSTATHLGHKPSSDGQAHSNLAAVEPSAWMVHTPMPVAPVQSTSYLIPLQILYFMFSITFMVMNAFSVDGVQLWHLISDTFCSLPSVFVSTVVPLVKHYCTLIIAPALWFTLGFFACTIKSSTSTIELVHNPLDDFSRNHRRHLQRPWKPRPKSPSIIDHGLHRSYPRRLRNDNQFKHRCTAPNVSQQKVNNFIRDFTDPRFVARAVRRHGPRPKPKPGSIYPGASSFHRPSPTQPPRRRGRGPRRRFQRKQSLERKSLLDMSFRPLPVNKRWKARSTAGPDIRPKPSAPPYLPAPQTRASRTRRHRTDTHPDPSHLTVNIEDFYTPSSANVAAAITHEMDRLSLISPSVFRSQVQTSDAFHIIWDTGASVCVTPHRSDFVQYSTDVDMSNVRGMGGDSSVVGQGTVAWSMHDCNGNLRHFRLKAYHIPSSSARLLSTSVLLSEFDDETITVFPNHLELSGSPSDSTRGGVIATNHPFTNLPVTSAYLTPSTGAPGRALALNVQAVADANINLTAPEKELLKWHQRLGHLAFRKIQHLMRSGVLSHTAASRTLHTAAAKLSSVPKCAACLFAKQTTRSVSGSRTSTVRDRPGILRDGNLLPGAEVSVDHFISSVKGRKFTGYDKGADPERFVGGCIFVDHCSSYIHIECQTALLSHETLQAKINFEKMCLDSGVVVRTYMSDNGTAFTSHDFTNHLTKFHQISKFAGVGAHHHNAQAERAIRTIMSIARAMMLHAGIHWPDMAQPSLWPMAVHHACNLWNRVPNPSSGLAPIDIFTKSRFPQRKLLDYHVWGCPVYVLNKRLQDGMKLPKWTPRSERAIYVGVSPRHSSQVPLVLLPRTGSLTPQFHVVFDDYFATVGADNASVPDFGSDEWNKLFGQSRFQYMIDDDEPEPIDDDIEQLMRRQQRVASSFDANVKPEPLPVDIIDPAFAPPASADSYRNRASKSMQSNLPNVHSDPVITDTQNVTKPASAPTVTDTQPTSVPVADSPVSPSSDKEVHFEDETPSVPDSPPPRRSSRAKKGVDRLTYSGDPSSFTGKTKPTHFAAMTLVCSPTFETVLPSSVPVYKASNTQSNPDIFSFDEAMKSEHRLQWIEAATVEIRALESFDCWEEVPFEQATTKVIPGTWVFRVKRAPDGTFKKFKARYCLRGDLQEGEFETYAPVVHFSSVRLFLAWSLLLNWCTCSVDFSNAFIQAAMTEPTFIHLPRGFRTSTGKKTCLRLKKSLYGHAQAPKLWFDHLWAALKSLGFVQSKHDKCLLFKSDIIIICYVDDLGIQAPHKRIIDKLVSDLRARGFTLTVEGSFSEFLGIQYRTINETTLEMTQQGLINKVLTAAGMTDCNPNKVPALKAPLGTDPDGEPMSDEWNYRSIVGMLLYLSTNTRPDIAYAVSQVARFSHSPKKSHATAVKTILRYLAGTKDRGTIFTRPQSLHLDCFVDADFAGLFGSEDPSLPVSVKSRTGYIIALSGCFILCKSQLQSTIALSTSEAEYGALSQAMRTLLPLRETVLEFIIHIDNKLLRQAFGSDVNLINFSTVIHEDNATALSLAIKQKITTRTKHWAVKSHFFWSHINDPAKHLSVVKVDTKEQRADYLTKGLVKELFLNCRRLNRDGNCTRAERKY